VGLVLVAGGTAKLVLDLRGKLNERKAGDDQPGKDVEPRPHS
jgi:hypothetical protein